MLTSIIYMPWTFKIVYGLIADNFSIWGSKRKAYIVLNGFVQFVIMIILSLNLFRNELFITGLLFINAMTTAFIDVVVDALMVVQSRRDPERGSEDL